MTVTLSEQTPLANKVDDSYTIPYEIRSGEETFEAVTYDESTEPGTKTPLTANISFATQFYLLDVMYRRARAPKIPFGIFCLV